jgi:multisubunit Na+/H+ antiporter MnhC subunit
MRPVKELLIVAVTIVAAAVIGFGVPLLWLWIGSLVQGGSGASSLDFSVAMLVLFGIIATYIAVLYLAGWVMAKADPSVRSETQRGTAREPWMRGMTDSRSINRRSPLVGGIERVFVITTLVVSAAFWLWLLFLAGSPLPNT